MITTASLRAFIIPRTYILSSLYIISNLLLPYILHQFGQSGQVLLPIYFFTIVATLHYGWQVGIITAIVSPLLSFSLTAMPIRAILPLVILKSALLVLSSNFFYSRTKKLTLSVILAIILTQSIAYIISRSLVDITIGYPGLILQIIFVPIVVRLTSNVTSN